MKKSIKNFPERLKRLMYGLSIMVLLGLLLFNTNPSREQFKEYIEESLVQGSKSEGFWERLGTELIASPTAWFVNLNTTRYDYGFYSFYSISLNGENVIYLGFFNTFIRIE
jgi:hypothetical protein